MPDLKKAKGLFLIQLPPPYHGVSIFNQMLISSSKIKESVEMDVLLLNTARYFEELNKFSLRKVIRTVRTALALFFKLLFKRYDFFYITPSIQGFAFYRDLLYIVIAKLFRVKLVYHLHGQGLRHARNTALNRFFFLRIFYRTNTIVLSQALIAYLSQYVRKEDCYIFPNAIPLRLSEDKLKEIARQRMDIDKKLSILFFSNLLISKGVLVLLDAVKILKAKYDFKVNFAGQWFNDGCKELFEKKVEQDGLADFIHLAGYCIGEEKNKWLSCADIFVHPTLNDAYALVILEAMQFCLPIVSTYEGAIPEILDNEREGLLVPKADAFLLAKAIERLINDKGLRMTLGINARKKFLENYTFDKYEERMGAFLAGFKNKK